MGEVASVSQHSNILKSRRHLLSCLVARSTTTAYLVIVEFLLCSASKREIEMLLFTVVRTFQEPVHDAVESILKSLLHFFFFHGAFFVRLQSAAEVACRTGGKEKKKVKLKNGAELPRRTPLNQSVIAGYKTESKTRRFHSRSCE